MRYQPAVRSTLFGTSITDGVGKLKDIPKKPNSRPIPGAEGRKL